MNAFLRWLNRLSEVSQVHTIGLIAAVFLGGIFWVVLRYGVRSAILIFGSVVAGIALMVFLRKFGDEKPPTPPVC